MGHAAAGDYVQNLDQYVNDKMPPLHHAMCGCEKMPNYPKGWGGQ